VSDSCQTKKTSQSLPGKMRKVSGNDPILPPVTGWGKVGWMALIRKTGFVKETNTLSCYRYNMYLNVVYISIIIPFRMVGDRYIII
jgi:hypothetical protein